MTIKQIMLAAVALGMIGNIALAKEEALPTVFFIKQPVVLVKNPELYQNEYTRHGCILEVPDHNEKTLQKFGDCIIDTSNICKLFFMTDAGKEQIQDMDMDCTIDDLHFFEPNLEDPHSSDLRTHTRTVRTLHPKELKNPAFHLRQAIRHLQHNGATVENIHDALDATIQ